MIRRLALVLSLTLAVLACSDLAGITAPVVTNANSSTHAATGAPTGQTPDRIASSAAPPATVAITAARHPSFLLLLLVGAFLAVALSTKSGNRPSGRRDDGVLPGRHGLTIAGALHLRAPPRPFAFR